MKQCSLAYFEWLVSLSLPEVPLVNLINPHLGFGKKNDKYNYNLRCFFKLLLCTVNLIIMGML